MSEQLARKISIYLILYAFLSTILLALNAPLQFIGALALGIVAWEIIAAILAKLLTAENGFSFDRLEWRIDLKYIVFGMTAYLILESFAFNLTNVNPLISLPVFMAIFSISRSVARVDIRQTLLKGN